MRYRWDPAYPMGRRYPQPRDADLRASDEERNAVADKLSRHYAEGRLDEAEFKHRLDAAMSATTRATSTGCSTTCPHSPASRRPRRRGTAASCPGCCSWPSSPSWPGRRCPSSRCTTCPGCSSPSWGCSSGGGPVGTSTRTISTPTTATAAAGRARSWTTEPAPCACTPRRTRSRDGDPSALGSMELFADLPDDELEEIAARCDCSPPPIPDRWCRLRTFPSACGTSSGTGTPSCSLTALRSDCWAGGTRGRSTRCSTSCRRPSLSWLSRHSRCSPWTGEPFSRSRSTTRSWPDAWWLVPPPRPTAWPCPCGMPWPIRPIPSAPEGVRGASTLDPSP